ncbi:MAG TPA: aspartate aminotransferase family protein [Planctomycetota bacterium]|nr:aspartate aminotransferase family protein [Planctomycetota bacterium]
MKTDATPQSVIEKKKKYLIPCTYHFYKDAPLMVRGEGPYLIDSEGKRYLDCYSGVSVNALGHCHPEVTAAICEQVKTLQHTTTIYLTAQLADLAEALAQVLPGELRRSFFCASGSEANEGAALLATLHTGRGEFIAFQNALHGRTKLGMSLTGLSFWRTDPNPVGGISFVPPPHCKQCPFGKTFGSCRYECVDAVEKTIQTSTSGKPAAMLVEPIQGNGGITVPPPEYFQRLRTVLDKYGMLLIADEVQTGLGRTGKMYCMEHWDVVPDIVTGGKALGGGTPIGYFATNDRVAQSWTRPSGSTFGGNPVTAVAAMTVLKIIQRDRLADRSAQLGAFLRERLEGIAKKCKCVADVRGKGLMQGLELSAGLKNSAAELADFVLEAMKDAGFLLGKTGPGRNVLTFMPPLIVDEAQLSAASENLEQILISV